MNQLFDFIKNQAEGFLNQNQDVNAAQSTQIFEEVEQTVVNGLQNMNPGELEVLQQEAANGTLNEHNPQIQGLTNQFTDTLVGKLGLGGGAAKGIAAMIIPLIIGKLMGSKQGSGNGLGLDSILGGILGGNKNANASEPKQNGGGGIMDQLSQIGAKFGLDKDGDGDVDLDDLKKMF